jgi:hypothetical protein
MAQRAEDQDAGGGARSAAVNEVPNSSEPPKAADCCLFCGFCSRRKFIYTEATRCRMI